jgi:SAM-dependent methyltransferase/uncharacterized protein YbaR (Trm112 family)
MFNSLLYLLVCPETLSQLRLYELILDEKGEIRTGILQSVSDEICLYPVYNGIPRMLPDSMSRFFPLLEPDIQKLPVSVRDRIRERLNHPGYKLDRSFSHVQKSFSTEWDQVREDDRAWGRDLSTRYQEFITRLDLKSPELEGKWILDAGCGHGEVFRSLLDSRVDLVGMDLSFSVDAVKKLVEDRHEDVVAGHYLVQGNIHSIPFKQDAFDYIFCDGVLHHTPDTYKGFQCITGTLKDRGKCFIMVYSNDHKKRIHRLINRIIDRTRGIRTRMPHFLLMVLSGMLAPLHWITVNLINLATGKKKYRRRTLRETRLSLFDAFSPLYDWHHSTDEVKGWYNSLHYRDIKKTFFNHSGIGIVGTMDKRGPDH